MNKEGGLILLNKPPGITSFKALGAIKKELGTGKVGHSGTLDKFAEGLIVALAGKMTKLVPQFTGMDKTYEALVEFGKETETLDPEGDIIAEAPIPDLETIQKIIPSFQGKIKQFPPAYSAIHINGKRAYERVRSGEKVTMPEREIDIFSLEIIQWKSPHLRIRVHCSKGTYIRSLARDLGIATGSRAFLRELKRVSVGPFDLDNSSLPDSFTEQTLTSPWELFDYLSSVEKRIVQDDLIVSHIKNGKESALKSLEDSFDKECEYALFDYNKKFLALTTREKGQIKYKFVC